MPAATATVTLDDEGVVKGLRTMNSEFRELGEAAEGADEGVQEFEEATGSAVGRMDQYNESIEEGFGLTRQFANAQEQLAQGGTDVVQSVDRQVDAMERMEQQTKSLSTRSSKFNQIVFSSGDLVQDLQFGIKGAANNIAFMAEQMAETAGEAGGFMGMMKGVGNALMGPAGMILALQTLLALGPQIASWFSSRTSEASDLNEELDEAASSMLSFRDEVAGFEVEGLKQAKQVRDTIQQRLEQNRALVGLKEEIAASGVQPQDVATLLDLIQERTQEELSLSELRERAKEFDVERLNAIQEQIPAQERALKRAKNMVASRRAARDLEKVIRDTVAQRSENQKEGAAQTKAWTEAMRDVEKIENRLITQTEEIDFSEELKIPKAAFVEDVADAEEALEKGLIGSIAGVNNVLDLLQSEFEQATSDKQRDRIRRLIEDFQALRDEMKRGEKQTQDFESTLRSLDKQRILADAIASNFTELAKAIGEGERVMESFGDAALGVLASVGTAMGKQMIAQGSALLASALIPGMQGNAAAGAALIAAGSTLVAASQALSSSLQSNSEGRPTENRQRVDGGGESTTRIEAPGRRTGGPVEAGRMYETHGLGRREFFVPRMDGRVLTGNQMQNATSNSRRVNVRTEVNSRVGVEDADFEFDLGRLRLRLDELETKVDKVT